MEFCARSWPELSVYVSENFQILQFLFCSNPKTSDQSDTGHEVSHTRLLSSEVVKWRMAR